MLISRPLAEHPIAANPGTAYEGAGNPLVVVGASGQAALKRSGSGTAGVVLTSGGDAYRGATGVGLANVDITPTGYSVRRVQAIGLATVQLDGTGIGALVHALEGGATIEISGDSTAEAKTPVYAHSSVRLEVFVRGVMRPINYVYGAGQCHVRFEVKDNGYGIPPLPQTFINAPVQRTMYSAPERQTMYSSRNRSITS